MNLILLILGCLILVSSCSPLKKAQRKARKADRLLKEAGILAPSIMDTVFIVKTDTIVLNKDSLVFKTTLLLDTVKVDSIIEKLIIVRQEGGDTRALRNEIYKELIPDLHYNSRDSLKITIDEEEHFVRFDMTIVIEDDKLIVTAKPVDNVPFTSVIQNINIDAEKKGRFWRGFQFGSLFVILLLIAAWIFRGAITTWIKTIGP